VIDEAVVSVPSVRHVVCLDRFGLAPALRRGFDIRWQDLVEREDAAFATVEVAADHPALLIFTSGTTGKPKGIVHSHCGLGVKMGMDTQLAWDFKPGDRVQYMVDFGWLGGPMVTVGTLLAGATFVMTEGAPDYPEPCRYWRVVQQFGSTIVGLAPTLARGLRRHGQAETERYDFSSLRLIAISGEPCDADTWTWVSETLGKGRVPVVNLSGGTEIGGILSANILFPMKPGAMHGPIPGTGADIVDAQGHGVQAGQLGELVMRQPCIGTARGLWREPQRFVESYFSQIPGMWAHGDLAIRDADGAWFIHGRSDDTLKVAGKRVGPAEVEAVLLATGRIMDAAVVAVDDAVKGSAIVCVVVPTDVSGNERELADLLSAAVVEGMGASFRPKAILVAADLPRTRNMKVMRRVVRAAVTGSQAGELSALHNPQAVDALRRLATTAGLRVEGGTGEPR
jgi:acetyl-CoA synthetase